MNFLILNSYGTVIYSGFIKKHFLGGRKTKTYYKMTSVRKSNILKSVKN